MNTKKKTKSGSVKIDVSVLDEARRICKENGWLISPYVSSSVREMNDKYKIRKTANQPKKN